MKFLVIAVLFFVSSFHAGAQTTNKDKLIRELLEVSGMAKTAIQMMDMMVSSYKKQMPAVGDEFWDELMKEVKTEDLVELMVPIYQKHFTESEIGELITFYKSAIGKKFTEKLPFISQESYAAGEVWGKAIGEKVLIKLKAAGYYQ